MGGMLFLTASDAIAKQVGLFYAPVQLLFLRAAIALPFVLCVTLALAGRRALQTSHLPIHLARGAINIVSASCFYMGLRYLPLAETTAIGFAAPLFVTALSVWILKERVDLLRWLAICLGFAGVLIIVRPGSNSFQLAALLPLATAFLYAVMMITAKRINAREGMLTTMFYIVLGQLVFASLPLAAFWKPIHWSHVPGFVGIAICSTAGLGLITQAFRVAPASKIAAFDYFGLITAGLLGWMFWNELPEVWFYVGAAMIAASGIYVALSSEKKS